MSSPPDPVSLERMFTHRLHTLSKLTDRLTQGAYLSDAGIALSEGRCLSAIGSFTPLSVKDLAYRANLDKGQASRAAQSLVDQGLVLKQASATDGRGVVLTLAPAGEAVCERLMGVIGRRNDEIVSCLNAAERAQLDHLLDRLVAHARLAGEGAGDADA
ncbi:MarR family winged helix-turn-helix transcriptional regulator [Polaromonas sp. CG_9.11]|uniref:MarR family winged helix-turn-helix transcriptional regulator n=1 Tax=Polaromonas sp. CG_9.11 TaxID=2787730 RepID=UPI0018C8F2F9|nr:MarR family transcriptional regulator [Polaromonas sp. CG_9.11]MBG6077224.1 DNA-binding MarR family transcriptional regulator [Polaromonas sp. CG_9.11]